MIEFLRNYRIKLKISYIVCLESCLTRDTFVIFMYILYNFSIWSKALLFFVTIYPLALLIMCIDKVLCLWVLHCFVVFSFYTVYMLRFVKLCKKSFVEKKLLFCKNKTFFLKAIQPWQSKKIFLLGFWPPHYNRCNLWIIASSVNYKLL